MEMCDVRTGWSGSSTANRVKALDRDGSALYAVEFYEDRWCPALDDQESSTNWIITETTYISLFHKLAPLLWVMIRIVKYKCLVVF